MKKLLIVLLLSIFFISCSERKSNIKVIENVNEKYLSVESVDKRAIPINNHELVSDLKSIISDLHGQNNKKMYYPIGYTVYIDENGNIDKIMIDNQYVIRYLMKGKIENSDDLTMDNIFQDGEKITEKMLPFFEKFKFKPAKLNGKSVPFRTKINTFGRVNQNGEVTFEISFLSGHGLRPGDNRSIDQTEYFVAVEEMPSPIGGIKSIQEKIHYPEIAKRAGIEGRVYIKAYIDEKGNVTNAEIIKGLDGGCNEEALKAVKETKFIPGRQRGKAVKVQVSIPILFKLDSK